ncbi:hypothetical protein GPA26_09015 [Aromatoleum petrolei]|uniref:Uncharacterized protein n=1 Tax=Aromatoleum petrolei TaxID=76116 RepID=A0ABX1MKX3_9RHOO|nr:hypothetical protein [Aromatoleum petrolei]
MKIAVLIIESSVARLVRKCCRSRSIELAGNDQLAHLFFECHSFSSKNDTSVYCGRQQADTEARTGKRVAVLDARLERA